MTGCSDSAADITIVFLVVLPPLNNVIANFKSTILDHPDLRDTKAETAALLETDFKLEPWSVTDVSVHAEALMMGLARTFWSLPAAESSSLDVSAEARDVLLKIFQVRHHLLGTWFIANAPWVTRPLDK